MVAEWIDAILEWIRAHPGAAGLTIAAVAFLEGLALIGILIPGIIILFGFGALVGLGILDLATVWFWCSVGAILGDGVSYWLGHHFKGHLRDIWPFTRFGDLLTQGEEFFRRHGLKCVVIGRFIGPIRGFVPFVAGCARMSPRAFIGYGIISAILWGLAYPGLGYVAGVSWQNVQRWSGRFGILIGVALVVTVLFCLLRKRFR